ncbi:MAG: pyruvate kinase [Bacilli bacterium]|nr:pyruvate kinase [Bacilli bacterium]
MEKQTKIICTLGPAIDNEEMLIKMFNAGMNVARLNFSHGTHEKALDQIKLIRNASKKAKKHIAIMLDTKGPEIRTGLFENNGVYYDKGDIVKLVKDEVLGNKERFHITCKELFNDVKYNDTLLIDDGKISLKVLEVSNNEITCEFLNGGIVRNHKGINAPSINLSMPFISQKDYEDIKFGCLNNVDAFALSFVRTKEDVLEVRNLLKEFNNPNIEIISKIESQQGIENLDEIIQVSDGIMVARGDLGVEVAPELVPMYQKKMITLANAYGKIVITATHMLESMIENPRPTRAEASDVANAILDGSDAIMLSGESAIGKYPLESVEYMTRIATIAENMIDHRQTLEKAINNYQKTINDAIAMAASEIALKMDDIKAIFAFTETGGTAKRMFKYRPKVPVIACTNTESTARKLAFYRGIHPVIAKYVDNINMCDKTTRQVADELGFKENDKILIAAGFAEAHGITNTIRIIKINK